MDTTQDPTTRVVISTDVTYWTARQREELFASIATIEAKAGSARRPAELEEAESTGWTLDAYHEAMAGLLGKHFVQANVINEAIKAGTGYMSREAVYELGGYPAERSLKGFTRPVNRIVQNLIEADKLPEDAEDLLSPVYDPAVKGYQRALGFQVPLEIVKIMQEAKLATSGETK